jgi:hypothetical protein
MRPAVLLATLATLAAAVPAVAQPWVPPRGEGSVSLTYQNYYTLGHFDPKGNPNTNGATHAKTMIIEVDVGVTDAFALTISLPYVATKYTGPDEYNVGKYPVHPGPLDDRTYHGTLQDLHIEARRVCWVKSVAIAPVVGVTIPTHDYATEGEAVPGRHRRELQVGATAGADLNRILPRTYAYGRYAVASAERIEGFPSVTSNLSLEGGVDATSFVSMRGIATWQFRHKGPTVDELHEADWEGHDRFIVSSYFNLGAAVSFYLNARTELEVVWVANVSGKSGAHRSRMLAVGTSWSFGKGANGWGGLASVKNRPYPSNPQAPEF